MPVTHNYWLLLPFAAGLVLSSQHVDADALSLPGLCLFALNTTSKSPWNRIIRYVNRVVLSCALASFISLELVCNLSVLYRLFQLGLNQMWYCIYTHLLYLYSIYY